MSIIDPTNWIIGKRRRLKRKFFLRLDFGNVLQSLYYLPNEAYYYCATLRWQRRRYSGRNISEELLFTYIMYLDSMPKFINSQGESSLIKKEEAE